MNERTESPSALNDAARLLMIKAMARILGGTTMKQRAAKAKARKPRKKRK